jgi:hypothetical protein
MDLYKAIAELYQLLRQVNEAIASLEALERGAEPVPVRRKRADLERPPKYIQPQKSDGQAVSITDMVTKCISYCF